MVITVYILASDAENSLSNHQCMLILPSKMDLILNTTKRIVHNVQRNTFINGGHEIFIFIFIYFSSLFLVWSFGGALYNNFHPIHLSHPCRKRIICISKILLAMAMDVFDAL